MIKKEDIKVGLRFYITRNDCLKCNFDPVCVHDNTPILFSIDRKDYLTWFCSSVETDYRITAYFSTESIMKFGTKFDIVTKVEGKAANENTDADRFKEITDKMCDIYKQKNSDYGSSFSKLFKKCGMTYAYGHLAEKIERIDSLSNNDAKVQGESMIDSLYDLANYSILTIMEIEKRKEHGTD